jgi:glycosyltransferase involved in cell wall biosynthesis
MERLTVIVPARNAEKTIHAAVSSTLRGLPHDGRLLVLDDASDDATGEIVAGLARADGRVGLLASDENLGVAAALNILIDAAETPLIARMDADDISLPWRFRRLIPALHQDKLDVVFSTLIVFGPSPGRVRAQAPVSTGPAASPFELLLVCSLMHPTLMGRRSSFIGAGGYRHVPAEDWDLWIRMALRGCRLGRIAIPTLLYRLHAQQTSESDVWKSAHAQGVETAKVHHELGQRLLGFSEAGAYAALSGPSAQSNEVEAAMNLIRAVRKASTAFSCRDRLSMQRAARIAMHRMKHTYGTLVT